MDNNAKSGGYTIFGTIMACIGAWGTMRDAQDMAHTIAGWSVELLFLVSLVAGVLIFSFGLSWLLFLNVGIWEEGQRRKATQKENEDRLYRLSLDDVYSLLCQTHANKLRGGEVLQRIASDLRKGRIGLYGTPPGGRRVKIPKEFWTAGTILTAPGGHVALKDSSGGISRYVSLEVDRREALNVWHELAGGVFV